jgi:hypothetical protein
MGSRTAHLSLAVSFLSINPVLMLSLVTVQLAMQGDSFDKETSPLFSTKDLGLSYRFGYC